MNNSVPSHHLEVKHAGTAIEYGTLPLLMESLIQQPVLVMPLEQSIQYGSVTIVQWIVHVTIRTSMKSSIAYATLPAAEVKQTVIGNLLMFPQPPQKEASMQHAQQLQQQLLECIITLLEQCSQVSRVVVPARHRIPDEWVWSARCQDSRILCRNGSWVIIEEGNAHA